LPINARRRGFSLTELLVATTLLATVTAGGLTAFSRAHGARSVAGELQQLHERAQYVFATLEPELQLAGYFGSASTPAPLRAEDVPEPAARCGLDVVQRLDLPLQAEPGWALPCSASGGGAMPASHVLFLRRAAARIAAGPQAGRAQWLSHATDLGGGGLYWHGDAPWASGDEPGKELRDLILRIYYVARESDGDAASPALRMKSLTSIAGVPAFIDTEVMPGVEDLHVELLPSPATPRALRVRLRVRADASTVRAAATPRVLDVTRYFRLRNAAS
jgi:prepilin-type N-terminal cleavage/methylation domain-containing protein